MPSASTAAGIGNLMVSTAPRRSVGGRLNRATPRQSGGKSRARAASSRAEKTEVSGVGRKDHFGAPNPMPGVFTKAGQTLRREAPLDLIGTFASVEGTDRSPKLVAVSHQGHEDIRGVAVLGHSNVEMSHMAANIGDDCCDIGAPIDVRAVVD
jgi:hypothetical protein